MDALPVESGRTYVAECVTCLPWILYGSVMGFNVRPPASLRKPDCFRLSILDPVLVEFRQREGRIEEIAELATVRTPLRISS